MAESAARAGFEVTAIDAFGDLDQHPGVRAMSMPRDFGVPFSAASAAEASRAMASEVVAYLSPFENHPSAVAALAGGRTLLGNDSSILKRVRDPRAFQPVGDPHSRRWLRKPLASGGGHGIHWWNPGDPVPRGSYVQPFIEGVPSSLVFVAANGPAVPFGLTRQLIGDSAFGADGFRYCGNILQVGSSDALESAIGLARSMASQFSLVGVNCIDFIVRDGAAFPIEINPRWSASMELTERAYGVSVFGMHAAACVTGELPSFDLASAMAGQAYGKAIVFARHDVVCGDTREWLDDPTVRDVPHPSEHIPAGRPVCTVFASGSADESCYAALVERARSVYEILDAWSSIAA